MGHLNRFQGRLLPYTNTGTIQEIPEISCGGSDITVQSSTLWSVHSAHGVHCNSKGGEIDGHTPGYKNPPVPRRLVDERQFPPNLSPAYPNSSEAVTRFGLVGEFRKIRTGTQTDLQFCRLPVRPQVRSGPANTGPVAEPSRKDTLTAFTTSLSGLAVHVLDRFTKGHTKASSPRPTAYETHTVASQKQLEGTRITRKGHSNTQVPAPTSTLVAGGEQCAPRSTIAPSKTCSANIYRRIKRRMGRSLKRTHCKRVLVTARKQVAYKLSGIKSSISSFKGIRRHLLKQDSSCSNRQHYSTVIQKQGRRHEVRSVVCPAVENPDLVYDTSGHSQSLTHFRPSECGSRQAIQTRPDHPNGVFSPSRGLPNNMQQVAPASNRHICHEVQQQVTSVCVTSSGSPGYSSGCTKSPMGGSGCICLPTNSHLGQSGGEVSGHLMQENHSDCPRVAHHALVLGPSGHVQSDPIEPAQPAQPVNTALQSDPSQKFDKPKSPCMAPRATVIKEQGFSVSGDANMM